MNYSINSYLVSIGDDRGNEVIEMYEIKTPMGDHLCNVDSKDDADKLASLLNHYSEFVRSH
jgi:hypothetical protein